MRLNLWTHEKTLEEVDCPDVVVGKERNAHEENMDEEKSAYATPKGSENRRLRWVLFSHIRHSFGKNQATNRYLLP